MDGREIPIPLPREPHRGSPAHLTVPVSSAASADVEVGALEEFARAKFGMFIHWGLYAVPAGEWKGKQVPGIGEWIMRWEEIPVAEYEELAEVIQPGQIQR